MQNPLAARLEVGILETWRGTTENLTAALYEATRLKQKQQSGTQQHMVVSEKRKLAILIGKAHKVRKQSINSMMPFVRYIVQNTENHGIPDD